MTSQLTTDASWTYNVTQVNAVPLTQTPTAEDASQLLIMAKKCFLDQSNLHQPAHLKVQLMMVKMMMMVKVMNQNVPNVISTSKLLLTPVKN